jgi:hypothetical protein
MRKLKCSDMFLITGGSTKSVVADIGCLGVGLSFGLINPLLGAIMGIGCSLAVYYNT